MAYTLDQLKQGIVAADKAGDTASVQALGAEYRKMQDVSRETNHEGMTHAQASISDSPTVQGFIRDLGAGALKGASQIGSTIISMSPFQVPGQEGLSSNQRRAEVTSGLSDMGANTNSVPFKLGQTVAEVAGTAGIGGALSRIPSLARAGSFLAKTPELINSGGFSLGAADTGNALANTVLRAGSGAITGAAMAGAVNPSNAASGAVIGGAMPLAGQVAGEAGRAIRNSFTASPSVVQLANKAKDLGIDIPADRLVDSPVLNAGAASLRYMPFSGRVGTEANMNDQIKQALSHTIGEDTPNLTVDVMNNAKTKLGAQFDNVLKNNNVISDPQLQSDLAANLTSAQKELAPDQFNRIKSQVEDLLAKNKSGVIDGQAAYNIKKTLDRLGNNSDSSVAYHAREVRNSLMSALNRSLSPSDAAYFAQLRQQYGNLKSLQPLIQNGAEGDISMARLGNMKGIRDPQVQDIASIASQFAKGRESPHGAMQRVAMGSLGAGALGGGVVTGFAVPVAAGLTAGRAANSALNSQTLKNLIMSAPKGSNKLAKLLKTPEVRALAIQSQSK